MSSENAIFFWIPKVAGTSIYNVLNKDTRCLKLKTPKSAKKFRNDGVVTFGHMDVNMVRNQNWIREDYYNDAFKFAFVRNPWDRVVSLYQYFKESIREFNMTFDDFILKLQKGIKPIGLYNRSGLSMSNSQCSWIVDCNGELMVDFVGRLENINDDFTIVQKELGLKTRLSHSNRSKRYDYKQYYNKKTRKIVREVFIDDVERFGYQFE